MAPSRKSDQYKNKLQLSLIKIIKHVFFLLFFLFLSENNRHSEIQKDISFNRMHMIMQYLKNLNDRVAERMPFYKKPIQYISYSLSPRNLLRNFDSPFNCVVRID